MTQLSLLSLPSPPSRCCSSLAANPSSRIDRHLECHRRLPLTAWFSHEVAAFRASARVQKFVFVLLFRASSSPLFPPLAFSRVPDSFVSLWVVASSTMKGSPCLVSSMVVVPRGSFDLMTYAGEYISVGRLVLSVGCYSGSLASL